MPTVKRKDANCALTFSFLTKCTQISKQTQISLSLPEFAGVVPRFFGCTGGKIKKVRLPWVDWNGAQYCAMVLDRNTGCPGREGGTGSTCGDN